MNLRNLVTFRGEPEAADVRGELEAADVGGEVIKEQNNVSNR
jgi:hypothetical protein